MAIMPKTTWSDVTKKLEACLADISTWMSANMLKLNEEKTGLIIFNPKHQVRMNEELRLQVGNNTVSVALSVKNLGILAHAMITSWLDYRNALLYGLPSTLMTRLQKVQFSSARLVTRTHKREHISPVLNSLHWITVIYRSQ